MKKKGALFLLIIVLILINALFFVDFSSNPEEEQKTDQDQNTNQQTERPIIDLSIDSIELENLGCETSSDCSVKITAQIINLGNQPINTPFEVEFYDVTHQDDLLETYQISEQLPLLPNQTLEVSHTEDDLRKRGFYVKIEVDSANDIRENIETNNDDIDVISVKEL